MELSISNIQLQNYKGISHLENPLYKKTKISGKNREGKTTIMDSVFDIFTNKMSDGSSTDNVRPHDENGVDVDRVEVVRGITGTLNGEPLEIVKTTRQKWVRPRGQADEVFDGNETVYKVNGFDMKPTAFKKWFSENIGDEEKFLMCMNAQPFLNGLRKSTADARKKIEELSGFDLNKFLEEHTEFAEIKEITKGNLIEPTMKQLKTDLKKQKDELNRLNVSLAYESSKPSESADLAEFELLLNTLKESRVNTQSSLDLANTKCDGIKSSQDEVMKLKFEQSQLLHDLKNKEIELREKQLKEVNALRSEKMHKESELNGILVKISGSESYEKSVVKEISEVKAQLKEEFNKKFVENDSNCICQYSGAYCESMKYSAEETTNKLKKAFESNKRFVIEKLDKRLRELNDSALGFAAEKNRLTESKVLLENEIKAIQKKIDKAEKSVVKSQEVDYTQNAKYIELSEKIASLEASIDKTAFDKVFELTEQLKEIERQIHEVENKISVCVAMNEAHDNALSDLKAKIKAAAVACAAYEKKLFMLENFSIEKNKKIAEIVNPHFRHIKFEFTDRTQEGNIFETLKIMVNGTNYMNGLNGGDKRLAELDICRGLQELNGFCLPIFVDEAATIDPDRIPEVNQQIILLERADNKLKVEEM